jgi:hypothetical protein
VITRKQTFYRYTCVKCRTRLFTTADFYKHNEDHMAKKLRLYEDLKPGERCEFQGSVYFLDKPAWIKPTDLETTGKISCPKCDAKIGTYSLPGTQCLCGCEEWIAPSYQIQPRKVDEFPVTLGGGRAFQTFVAQPTRRRPVCKPPGRKSASVHAATGMAKPSL